MNSRRVEGPPIVQAPYSIEKQPKELLYLEYTKLKIFYPNIILPPRMIKFGQTPINKAQLSV